VLSYVYQTVTYGDEKYERIVDSDGKGYYAYLPALFIYNDLSFQFYFKKEHQTIKRYFHERFLISQGNKTVLKTYCGEAMLLLPFFAAGCAVQCMYAGSTNGFEAIPQFFICIGALFYLALGFYCLHLFLRRFGMENRIIYFSLFAFIAGTNLLYYAVFHPIMPHVYSFSLIAIFLYLSQSFIINGKRSTLLATALVLGLITILRPINFFVVLIVPFLLWQEVASVMEFFKQHFKKILLAILCFWLILSIQLLLNYMQCGRLFPWSYGDEGFYFLHPHFFSVLFSFRNGLFIYSPLVLLSCFGFVFMFQWQRKFAIGVAITLLVSFYFISSWWSWYFGGGFGHRASIDWYSFFIISFTFLLQQSNRVNERVYKGIAWIFIFLNLFQTWQYLNNIIHPEGMTFEKYAYVFLKASPQYYRCIGDGTDDTYLKKQEPPYLIFKNGVEATDEKWNQSITILKDGRPVIVLNDAIEYGPVFKMPLSDTHFLQSSFLRVSLARYENEFRACTNSLVKVDFVDEAGIIYWTSNMRLNDIPRKEIHQWKKFDYDFPLPAVRNLNDSLAVYIWNIDKKSYYLADMQLSFYAYKRK
jgi:hypothetical protein